MQPANLNKRLAAQLTEIFGSADVPDSLRPFLEKVSTTYDELNAKVEQRTEQLMASTSGAYSFLDSLHMGLVMWDINLEVVFSNTSARKIFAAKMPKDANPEATTLTLDVLIELFQPALPLKDVIQRSLHTNLPLEFKEVDFGNRALRLFIAPMAANGMPGQVQQVGAVMLVEDITDQVVAERSKDEFFSIASHELRTPLTAIRGNASLITTYYKDKLPDKNIVEMVDDIHASAVRLIEIVNDFLDVSSLEQGRILMNPEIIKPAEVVQEVIHEMQSLAQAKNIALVVDQSVNELPTVKVDRRRLKQVIYNLVGNALKFTDEGSVILQGGADDKIVEIAVTDTGPGMSAEDQRMLFKKFQQANTSLLTRDATQGTGLGLYISKLIVQLSGGKIWLARTEVGKGTTFIFSLPRTSE
jgi:signal transduction histidine kinase